MKRAEADKLAETCRLWKLLSLGTDVLSDCNVVQRDIVWCTKRGACELGPVDWLALAGLFSGWT